MDQHQGEQDADDQPQHLTHQPEDAGLQDDGAPHLPGIRTSDTQQANFLTTLQHQRQHRGRHTGHGDEDGDDLQRPGDGKGGVKDAQHLPAQSGIRKDGDKAMAIQLLGEFITHRVSIKARL